MANLKSPGRQSSFEYFSPINAVLNSVGVQHEKALKQAFYNTVALVFVLAGGAAGVAVYFVLGPFLKPLLWAGLCGAFLHPFKSTMTRIFRKWLSSLRSSSTPLVVGSAVVPFQLINNCSDIVGGFIAKRLRLIVILTLLTPFLYGLYVFRPFLEILSFLYQVCSTLYIFMDYFSNPFAVWSIIIGYGIALIFWWTPSSSPTMRILSFPVWMAFVNYLASIAGVYRVPLFLVVISLTVVGFVTDATGSKDQVDGSGPKDEPNKRSSIIEGLSVAASVLSPITYDSDESCTSNIEDIPGPKPSPEKTSNETPQSAMPTDSTDGRETRLQRIRRQNRPRLSMKKKSKSKSASYPYFVALIWGILLMRVWMHAWILQLLPIPFAIYLIKLIIVWSGAWACLLEFLSLWYDRLREWTVQRKDAIMPAPIRGTVKLVMRGDQKVNYLMEKSIDNLMSVFMVIGLVIVSITVTVLLAVQVHHESVHLVTVTGNLVNDVMAKNPQLLKWISENAEFKKTLDSAVERGYILGRKWIAAKVGTYLGESGNTTQLQQSVLEFTDRFYHAWMGEGNNSSVNKVANGSIGWTRTQVNETAADLSWGNAVSLITKLDFKVLFSVVKENLGILMSLLESVYMILKGNVTLVFNLVTMVLSMVFFSGTYVLNTGLSMIVFVTALFYLLSTSGDQYKPVEWFGQMFATGTAGFGESLFKAIGDVFGAALKMATFYGLYTWFTHTLFGINIVFIPSALAAVAAVVPFIGTYWAAIPAVLELWLVQEEGALAIILAICHILPISFVDTAIYSEISGGGHPYLTGLAVAGGIYCVGLEGAIIGPIVLCCLIVACQVYGSMIAETSPTSGEPTIMSAVEGERVSKLRGHGDQYKKTPLQKQMPYRE